MGVLLYLVLFVSVFIFVLWCCCCFFLQQQHHQVLRDDWVRHGMMNTCIAAIGIHFSLRRLHSCDDEDATQECPVRASFDDGVDKNVLPLITDKA